MNQLAKQAEDAGDIGDLKSQLAYLVLEQNECCVLTGDYGGPSTKMVTLAKTIVDEQDTSQHDAIYWARHVLADGPLGKRGVKLIAQALVDAHIAPTMVPVLHPRLVAELVHESYSTWLSALLEARNEQDREVCARRLRTLMGGDATTEQLMTVARWVAAQMHSDA
jgi:hypothetical protein